jgi:hypothetical protein
MYLTKPSSMNEAFDLTPQVRHFNAAECSEKAIKHHRQAALLHDAGDVAQASIHASLARKHTVAALMACDADSAI